jgi:hypothetical protein
MRALILILIVAIILAIAAVATGYVNVTNIRGRPPEFQATRTSITLKGGQPPAFDVEAGSVKVGTKQANVNMPTLEVRKPAPDQKPDSTNNMM